MLLQKRRVLSNLYRRTTRMGTEQNNEHNNEQTNLLQGTLDVMILKALALEELHGLGISRRISQITRGTFQVKPGSLFPALHRMEEAGWLSTSWGESETNRRAKFYKLKIGRAS